MAAQLGLKAFEEAFKGLEDQYVLIGGSATQLAMEDAGQQFTRTTKDLDIVVIVDALTPQFIERFWLFIKEGKYQSQQKSDATKQFYRFKKPETPGYPTMLELFSRKPDFLQERDNREMRVNCCQFRSTTKESFSIVNHCSNMGRFCNSLGTWVWGAGGL